MEVTWYDGVQRPPTHIQALALDDTGRKAGEAAGSRQTSFAARTASSCSRISGWRDCSARRNKGHPIAPVAGEDHWHQFINAARGVGKTTGELRLRRPAYRSGPSRQRCLRFPRQTLDWDAPALKFENVAEANRFVRRTVSQRLGDGGVELMIYPNRRPFCAAILSSSRKSVRTFAMASPRCSMTSSAMGPRPSSVAPAR